MIYIFLTFLIPTILTMYLTYRSDKRSTSKWQRESKFFDGYRILASSMIGGLALAVAFIVLVGISMSTGTPQIKSVSSLASINDGKSVNGRFFLGIGGIGSSSNFSWYQNDNGTYRLYTVGSERAAVKYDSTPRVEMWKSCDNVVFGFESCSHPSYVFYVPEGTIKTDYELDAK